MAVGREREAGGIARGLTAAVCEEMRCYVAGRQDKLIETLAHEMAEHLLRHFELVRVDLELRKFILPETKYVAVKVTRWRERPLL